MPLTSRSRVLAALEHREADRVPVDVGGTTATGIHVQAYRALRAHLNLPLVDVTVLDPWQQLARVDEDVVDLLGLDVAPALPADPSSWAFSPQLRDGSYLLRDEWQMGWRMPADGGLYYDVIESPLAGPLIVADIDRFAWPDLRNAARFRDLRSECETIRAGGRASVVRDVGDGLMEMASWMRGIEQFYVDLKGEPQLAGRLLDSVLDTKLAYWERALDVAGDVADVAYNSDDYCGQNGPLIAPRMWREVFKPRLRELFAFIHSKSAASVFFHSCGAVRVFIPDLIEIGVDILNPVQVSAKGMDTAELKREFGQEMVFWGGGAETQGVLPRGTANEVRDEVRRRLDDLMPGGGFVFSAVHNIQPDVPPENIVAMLEAVRDYGSYGA